MAFIDPCGCCPLGLTPPIRCYAVFEEVEATPWVIALGGQSATKNAGSGIIITATIVGASHPAQTTFFNGCPAGACDPNALTERHSQLGFIDMEFDCNFAQPFTRVRVIDFDNPPGPIEERAIFAAPRNVIADVNTPLNSIPGGNPGGVGYFPGPNAWIAPAGQSERSARLEWNSIPWGNGNPLAVRFQTLGGNPAVNSASQYDFAGQIFGGEIRQAIPMLCDGEIQWFDLETSEPVDPDNFVDCS